MNDRETLTLDKIQRRVAQIAAVAYDDERAHGMEDALHQDVLRAIANDRILPPADIWRAADLALSTQTLDFARWCA